MKTFKEFVKTNEHLSENVFNQINQAATMYRLMTGIDKFPNFGPFKAPKVRAPLPTPKPAPVPTIKRASNPIAATLQAVSQLQGSTPQSGPAAERAKANRETAIQSKWGDAMNKTPSRFGKAGPDVPKTPAASPEQGVGTKPRVAAPYTPPRPAAKPEVTIPRANKPRVDPFAPVGSTRSVTTERPRVAPKPEKKYTVGDRQLTKSQINTEYQKLRTSDPTKAKQFGLTANKSIYGK